MGKKFGYKPPPKPKLNPVPPDKPEETSIVNRGYWPGSNFNPEELAWLKAVEKLQKKTRRKFLSHVDYLRLALQLGYHQGDRPPKRQRKRSAPTPPPPLPANPMNPEMLLARLSAMGFTFSLGADGLPKFTVPPGSSNPDRDELLGILAWTWASLSQHLTAVLTPKPSPPLGVASQPVQASA